MVGAARRLDGAQTRKSKATSAPSWILTGGRSSWELERLAPGAAFEGDRLHVLRVGRISLSANLGETAMVSSALEEPDAAVNKRPLSSPKALTI